MTGKDMKLTEWPEGFTPTLGSHGSALPYFAGEASPDGFPRVQALERPAIPMSPFVSISPPRGDRGYFRFSEGNGTEHRNSFKGFATGFAQLIESPQQFSNAAMIINTNKKLTSDSSAGPIGGPVPRMSLAPEGADYQSVLECPCTSRVPKLLRQYNLPRHTGGCPATRAVEAKDTKVQSAEECAHAQYEILHGPNATAIWKADGTARTPTVDSATLPGKAWRRLDSNFYPFIFTCV